MRKAIKFMNGSILELKGVSDGEIRSTFEYLWFIDEKGDMKMNTDKLTTLNWKIILFRILDAFGEAEGTWYESWWDVPTELKTIINSEYDEWKRKEKENED